MLKVIILEDDRIFAKLLAKELQNNSCEVVAIASSYNDAKVAFDNLQPNFAFIDIQLENDDDGNGVDFAEFINKTCRIPFIFISAHTGTSNPYFKRATATMPANYLPKGSFLPSQLWHFVEIALNNYSRSGGMLAKDEETNLFIRDQFFIKKRSQWEKVHAADIQYIKVKRPYCEIKTKHSKTYLVRKPLEYILDILALPQIVRIHQSHAVNMAFVTKYDSLNNLVIMEGQLKFEVGKTFRNAIKERILLID